MNLGIGDRRALANLIAQALVGKVYDNEHQLTNVITELVDEFFGLSEKPGPDYKIQGKEW